MREIKYKIYDRKLKEMLDVEKLKWTMGNLSAFEATSCDGGGLKNVHKGWFCERLVNKQIRFELIQSTGLKDRNGTKIYEGDILNYESRIVGKRMLVVEWSQWDAMFIFGEIRVDYATKNSEVIGNIYENPELLKEE